MSESQLSESLLCLASHSPRRRRLLETLGVPFFVRAAGDHVEEDVLGEGRGAEAESVALGRATVKGREVARSLASEGHPVQTVLAADTVVHLGDTILDKPSDAANALTFLDQLSGQRHGVVTALWLLHEGRETTCWTRTWVDFDSLDQATKQAYVSTGEPFDKAGGYGIQGAGGCLVKGIEGCYFNVMGLPLQQTRKFLLAAGLKWPLFGNS